MNLAAKSQIINFLVGTPKLSASFQLIKSFLAVTIGYWLLMVFHFFLAIL